MIQVDGYAGFEKLAAAATSSSPPCWAHTRRKFYEVHQATASPIAEEMLRRIAALYTIEDTIRGQTAAARQVARHAKSLPHGRRPQVPARARTAPRPAAQPPGPRPIRYALSRWPELCRFLDDGRLELDTNTVERAIRPIALGRKNHLFAGSDGGAERWATVASLIATAKLNGVEPFAYLKDVLERMTNGHPMRLIDELPPLELEAVRPPQLTDGARNGRLRFAG